MKPLEMFDRSGRTLDTQGPLMQLLRSLLVLTTMLIVGCGGSTPVTPPPPPPPPPGSTVDHVVIDNGAFTMNVGTTRQLQSRALTATGEVVADAVISFSSSSQAAATVNSSGLVTAVAPGTTTITATANGKTATVVVTVQLVPVATFTAVIDRQTIKTNDTTRIVATLRDANNGLITNRAIDWRSSDTTVALVGPAGIVFGLHAGGPVTITGTVDGKTVTVTVLVTPALIGSVRIIPDSTTLPPGDSLQLRVEVLDEFGGTVENPEVIWASVGAQFASVSPTGLLKAVQFGQTVIQATAGGVTGHMPVNVAIPETEKFHLSINNHLRYPLYVTQNDVVIGQAGASTVTVIDRPLTPHATFGWSLVRPNNVGEMVGDVMPDILNPTGTITMNVTNVLSDGRVFFTPQVRNLTSDKVWLRFPVIWTATPCLCAASPLEIVSREYGYWLLTPQSTMDVYQISDVNFTGPKLSFPVLPGQVQALTGVWTFNLLTGP